MKHCQSGTALIVHALLFAGAILISSALLADTDHHQTITGLLIALWFSSSALIQNASSGKSEWACIRRRLGLARKD